MESSGSLVNVLNDDSFEKFFFAGEVPIQNGSRNPGFLGDVVHPCSRNSPVTEARCCSRNNQLLAIVISTFPTFSSAG